MNKPTDKQIADTLARVASPDEAREVVRWFATEEGSVYLDEAFDKDASAIHPGDEDLYVPHAIPSEEIWAQIRKRIHRAHMRRMLFRAAAILLPLILFLGLYQQLDSRVNLFGSLDYEEIYVPKGERLQMLFQDGTKVYINSDTRLRYPKKFGIASREVELSGEAYFMVAQNKKRPFVIHLGGPSVYVVGTSFNIQCYPENDEISLCLDEGKVNMKLVSEEEVHVLPGQQLFYDKERDVCRIVGGEDMQYQSVWKQNVIAFKDASLEEVLTKLHRWYNVTFEVSENVSKNLFITLTSEQTILENVLRDLEKITSLSFDYDAKLKQVKVHCR